MYAECDNAAERLLLAVGCVSMGRVAREGFNLRPSGYGPVDCEEAEPGKSCPSTLVTDEPITIDPRR